MKYGNKKPFKIELELDKNIVRLKVHDRVQILLLSFHFSNELLQFFLRIVDNEKQFIEQLLRLSWGHHRSFDSLL